MVDSLRGRSCALLRELRGEAEVTTLNSLPAQKVIFHQRTTKPNGLASNPEPRSCLKHFSPVSTSHRAAGRAEVNANPTLDGVRRSDVVTHHTAILIVKREQRKTAISYNTQHNQDHSADQSLKRTLGWFGVSLFSNTTRAVLKELISPLKSNACLEVTNNSLRCLPFYSKPVVIEKEASCLHVCSEQLFLKTDG